MLRHNRLALSLGGIAIAAFVAGILATQAYGLVGFGRKAIRGYRHSGLLLRGTLLNGAGDPAPGVGVLVGVAPLGGARSYYRGDVTDGRGRYSVRVPRGESRRISVSAGGTATQEILELVSPRVWVTVTPRGNGVVLFQGGVEIGRRNLVPTVLLQDLTPDGWKTFGAVNPSGRNHLYRYVYRNAPRGTVGFRFSFRAATLPDSAWLRGYSEPRSAVVR